MVHRRSGRLKPPPCRGAWSTGRSGRRESPWTVHPVQILVVVAIILWRTQKIEAESVSM